MCKQCKCHCDNSPGAVIGKGSLITCYQASLFLASCYHALLFLEYNYNVTSAKRICRLEKVSNPAIYLPVVIIEA